MSFYKYVTFLTAFSQKRMPSWFSKIWVYKWKKANSFLYLVQVVAAKRHSSPLLPGCLIQLKVSSFRWWAHYNENFIYGVYVAARLLVSLEDNWRKYYARTSYPKNLRWTDERTYFTAFKASRSTWCRAAIPSWIIRWYASTCRPRSNVSDRPKILLLDEPFSALDYQTKLKLEDLVFSLLRKYKKTSLLVTHDIEEAIAMSDRIYLLQANPGKIAKTFIVPESIRSLSPLESRHHHDFPSLFQNIWKELERLG